LVKRIIDLARRFGRYGCRRITALLRGEGWRVNHKRVERVWRQEGLKVPSRQPRRGRLWLNDGSCVRLRPTHKDHVWSYDFVHDRMKDGRALRMLTIVDEYTRECLCIDVARKMSHEDVLERLAYLFVTRGMPKHVRSDNGGEFTDESRRVLYVGITRPRKVLMLCHRKGSTPSRFLTDPDFVAALNGPLA
jgi:transposase InsO family protein